MNKALLGARMALFLTGAAVLLMAGTSFRSTTATLPGLAGSVRTAAPTNDVNSARDGESGLPQTPGELVNADGFQVTGGQVGITNSGGGWSLGFGITGSAPGAEWQIELRKQPSGDLGGYLGVR